MLTLVSFPAVLAFAALAVALLSVRLGPRVWTPACIGACAAAFVAGIVDARGLASIVALAAVCIWARRETRTQWAFAAHALTLSVCAAFFLHVVPGFDNPRVVDAEVVSPGALPYTKYLNFDKGIAGLFLIALYMPRWALPTDTRSWHARVAAALGIGAVLSATVMLLSVAFGYVTWNPKLPPWTALWMWSMVFLTALPEEALFRGVVQNAFERWMGQRQHATAIAVVGAGALFGFAHLAGGPLYVLLASIAGAGYGWIYASTRSLALAIAAHAGLNTIHFLLFTYPALNR